MEENGHQDAVSDQPPSRPLTPTEQLTIMKEIENEEARASDTPTDRDLDVKKPYFYIQNCTY
jgi:hypothetical protein